MTSDELRQNILRVCKVASADSDINIVAFNAYCDSLMALGADAERNILAAWMIQFGFATGHGDTTEALLQELDWQIAERIAAEREACAKVCEELLGWYEDDPGSSAANAIRARSNT